MPVQFVGSSANGDFWAAYRRQLQHPASRKLWQFILLGAPILTTPLLVVGVVYQGIARSYDQSPRCGGAASKAELPPCTNSTVIIIAKHRGHRGVDTLDYVESSGRTENVRLDGTDETEWSKIRVGMPAVLRDWKGRKEAVVQNAATFLTNINPHSIVRSFIGAAIGLWLWIGVLFGLQFVLAATLFGLGDRGR